MNQSFAYKLLVTGCLFITIITCVASCSDKSQNNFRIGSNLWPGYEPLYLARHNGYYDRQIRLVEYPSATEVLRAFRNGSLEAACLTLDEALLLRQANIAISIVLVTDISEGGDVIIARKGITSIDQLEDKVIAVETGALGAYVITRALEKHNMSLDQVKIRHLSAGKHQRVFDDTSIDAVVTFEPARTHLIASGGTEIFSSRDLPGEIVDIMVVDNDAIEKYEDQIRASIQGWFRALDDLRNDPNKSAQFISRRTKLTPRQVLDSYRGMKLPTAAENIELLGGPEPGLAENIRRMKKVMENQQLIRAGISTDNLLSDEFIPEE